MELRKVEIKTIKEIMKEEQEQLEIKRLEKETEVKIEILKQTEKTVRKYKRNKKKSKLDLKELETKEIIEITTEKEL